jgi:hypothetical protein
VSVPMTESKHVAQTNSIYLGRASSIASIRVIVGAQAPRCSRRWAASLWNPGALDIAGLARPVGALEAIGFALFYFGSQA